MARYIYQGTFKDGNGRVVASGTISVYLAGTTTAANVYTASAGGSAVNSVTSDTDGHFLFYIDDGDYTSSQQFKIALSKTNFTTKTYDNIRISPLTDRTKNAVINGNFDIWQRGTTFNAAANNDYTADRWQHAKDGSGATINVSQQSFTLGQTDVPNEPEFFFRHDVAVAGTGETYHAQVQAIEDVRAFAGQTVNLSFYAKAASSIILPRVRAVQFFGTGGSPTPAVYVNFAVDLTIGTTWTKYTYSITVPSISGKTLGTNNDSSLTVYFYLPLDSTLTFDLAQVQLEKGSQATEFDNRPIAEELALCQRYYEQVVYGANNKHMRYASAGDEVADFPINFSEKRDTPAMGLTGESTTNGTSSVAATNAKDMFFRTTSTALGNVYTNNGTITADAEL